MVQTNKNYKKNNPFNNTNMIIIAPSWQGHRMFMKHTLSSYKKTGKYVICSYDSHGVLDIPKDIYQIPDAWVFKHQTYGAGKRNGWLWDIIYASGIADHFEQVDYVFTTNTDCIWEKPENIDKLVEMMGNAELMSSSSFGGTIHTCNMLWKTLPFLTFVDYIKRNLNNNIPASYSPEVLLRDWAKKTGMNVKDAPKQPIFPKNHTYEGGIDHYSSYNQDCTWKQVLGYRNLGGEHKQSCLEHLEPVPNKYVDLRNGGEYLNQHERNTLFKYYVSGDRRWLYKYWAEGEDSYWNRRYYPLDYYGKESLSDDSRRKELGPPSERLGHFDRWKFNSFILKDDEYYSKWKAVIEGSK